jgi:hypothetical protein
MAETARGEVTPTDLEQAVPVTALDTAAVQFHRARNLLDSPALLPVRYLPVIGRQVESARALAGAGAEAADATGQGLIGAHELLAARPTDGPARLSQMRQALAIAITLDRRLHGLHYGPRLGLVGSLATAHNELQRDVTQVVTGLDKTLAAGHSLIDLMSGNHRVLLLATNNAEMRAGSGIILEIGVLNIDDGTLQLQGLSTVDNYPVPKGSVTPPPDLAARWGWLHPADDWDELLNSPRFDVTAPTAAKMWAAAGQSPVDAVMAIDPAFLADLVSVTGPVTVGGQSYAGSEIEAQVLNNQYLQTASRTLRQDILGQLAQATFTQVNGGGWSLTSMFQALAADAGGRHLIVWSDSPGDETGWVRSGVAGVLTPKSLMVSILNRGRNKLDWYLHSASTLTISKEKAATKVTVTVHLDNTTPSGLTGEIVGDESGNYLNLYPGQQLTDGDYLGIVALSAPRAAAGMSIAGTPQPPINGPDGPTQVIAAQYIIRRGTTLNVTFTFTLPGTHGAITMEPEGRYPAMTWTWGATTWTGDHQKLISW